MSSIQKSAAQRPGPAPASQEKSVVMMDHRRARSRRTDNEFRVAGFVQFNKAFGHSPRLGPVAGIEGRLATASLALIKFDFATRPPQHFNRGSADAAPHLIDNAGYKQTDLDTMANWRLPVADCWCINGHDFAPGH